MKRGILKNKTRASVIAKRIRLCRGLFDRMRGLLGTQTLSEEEACWLVPCSNVHTIGMQYPIDVYFLNKKNKIIALVENLAPNRFSPLVWKAHSVLEFKSGIKRDVRIGDELLWEENSCAP